MTKVAASKSWAMQTWPDGSHRSKPVPTSYSTSFGATENPISQGGIWLGGLTNGTNWTNIQTASGIGAYATQTAHGTPPFDDSEACLNPLLFAFTRAQFAQGTVYNPSGAARWLELELTLNSNIASTVITQIEIDIGAANGTAFLSVVRWNGALNDFTFFLNGSQNANITCNHGDVWRAEIRGNAVLVFCNTVQVFSGTITGVPDGTPGIGAFVDAVDGTPTANNTLAWSAYSAGNL